MFRRSVPIALIGICLGAAALPAIGQQEDAGQAPEGEDNAAGEDTQQGVEPPSITMVHYGPGDAGGSLASLYPDQALELGQGENVFTGLLKRETVSERHGGVLVVAPSGQSPDQGVAGAVRTQLTDAGWLTLSIAQPAEPVADLPERVLEPVQPGAGDEGNDGEETAQNGNDAEGDSGSGEDQGGDEASKPPDMTIRVAQDSAAPTRDDEWQQRATDRLAAAVNVLRNENVGPIALVGVGDGADLVLRYVSANGATFPPGQFGMVWVDARLRPPFSDGLVAELGEGYSVPVLDLYDRDLQSERAEKRSAAARRGGFSGYTQSAIPIPRGGQAREQRRVSARIRGWLSDDLESTGGQ